MALPPIHRVDHTPVCVLSFDTAWKREDLARDLAAWKGAKGQHPISRYQAGESRCDLGTVAKYLDESAGPVKFEFRRLDFTEWQMCQGRAGTVGSFAAIMLALRYALAAVHGAELELERVGRVLTDATMDKLRALVGDDGMRELADHAWSVSRETTEAEKKP